MRSKAAQIHGVLAAMLVAGGCATSGGAGLGLDGRARQADEKLPAAARFSEDAERKLVEEAQGHQLTARKALDEGNSEKARVELAAAAERFVLFADTRPGSEWRLAFRFKAAELQLFAQQHERAAAQAEKVLADPAASDVTRAMAAQVAATAWRGVALQRVKAGELEPMKLATAEQRGTTALNPHPPADPWRRVVVAVDAYLSVWQKHPEIAKRPAERSLGLTPWQAALVAAEVKYSCDDMADAEGRLDKIVDGWPGEADVMDAAVRLLLETFLVRKDDAGFSAAKDRVKKILDEQLSKAQDPRSKETFAKTIGRVAQLGERLDFSAAKRLLDGGKPAEAAEGFEKFAEANPDSTDAANALFNAALAWDAAGRPEKAVATRERLVAKHSESRVAPVAALHLAGAASKRGDHEAAARYYGSYLERWPDAANRCIALQNIGFELDVQNQKVEAAERYLSFGSDVKCASERPNEAAKALYRCGKLFIDAKQKSKAKDAFEAATRVGGVTDPAALSQIEDAKRQIKRL